jgi:hypothetical protein
MDSVQLGDAAGYGWIKLRSGDVYARGNVRPRLLVTLHAATTREKRYANIHLLRAKLLFGNEELAEGLLLGVRLNYMERSLTLEIPISRAALQYVTDNATGERIDLKLDMSGWMQVRREPTEDEPARFQEDPELGEWGFLSFGEGHQAQLDLQVARSHWFTLVLDPVGSLRYVVTEIPLPKGGAGAALQATLNHLREAERRYAAGDDPGVFFSCRAALETLPGAPKQVFDPLPDRDVAERIDAVMKETVAYLHRGRHPKRQGDRAGEFPVDHADAQFALSLTRLLVAQTSRLLNAGMA